MDGIYRTIIDSWKLILPELTLLSASAAMFVGSLLRVPRTVWPLVSLGAITCGMLLWVGEHGWLAKDEFIPSASLFITDPWRWLGRGIVYATGSLLVLSAWQQVSAAYAGEYFACLTSLVAGAGLVVAANDLVSLFLGLEIVSLSTYVVLYISRRDLSGLEATIKYFLLSIFSSAIFLFGVSLLYLAVGRTNYLQIRLQLQDLGNNPLVLVSGLFVIGGLGFRLAAVPFHFYAPEVFAGTHPIGAALLAVMPKVVGFLAIYQVLTEIYAAAVATVALNIQVSSLLLLTISVLAGASMLLGNLGALQQDNIYRLLAYSSIAHTGYMLVGLAAGAKGQLVAGEQALVFYLGAYVLMSVGVFVGLLCVRQGEKLAEYIDELSGLARSRPMLALCLAVGLLSLTGLPPTLGFWGKVLLFLAAWNAPEGQPTLRYLAVFLAVNAAIGAWYYLRVIGVMYLRQPVRSYDRAVDIPAWLACGIGTVATLVLFFVPGLWWGTVARAFSGTVGP